MQKYISYVILDAIPLRYKNILAIPNFGFKNTARKNHKT